MDDIKDAMMAIHPDLMERQCGGWLAVSPQNAPLRIGVTGNTQADAIARFSLSMKKWIETLYNADNGKEGQ